MNYCGLQPRWFLEKIERFHFQNPDAPFQWWYFDLLLQDGSLFIVAFMPRQWWPSQTNSDVSQGTLFVTLRDPAGSIQKWQISSPHNKLTHTDMRIAVEGLFMIEKKDNAYRVSVTIEDIKGTLYVINQPLKYPLSRAIL